MTSSVAGALLRVSHAFLSHLWWQEKFFLWKNKSTIDRGVSASDDRLRRLVHEQGRSDGATAEKAAREEYRHDVARPRTCNVADLTLRSPLLNSETSDRVKKRLRWVRPLRTWRQDRWTRADRIQEAPSDGADDGTWPDAEDRLGRFMARNIIVNVVRCQRTDCGLEPGLARFRFVQRES
ncbi:hypothetical protein GY45DRAFT_1145419 [Cubamyces sp. BRFM 1775]|nr:hypothetical protein GY45DRAFT_1145419 [Cubamyces sp. BRFM 1775]